MASKLVVKGPVRIVKPRKHNPIENYLRSLQRSRKGK